jgi:GTPase SAR1 family protein
MSLDRQEAATHAPHLIDQKFSRLRSDMAHLLERLQLLAQAAGNRDLPPVIGQLRTTILDPFFFVVVGEIKAGKSSFINALLGAEICRVDPAPCTDVIQEIVWSAAAEETRIGPHLRRVGLPAEILRDIAIVDTPGTNTIIAHHQEITQRYIPNSGLVIFVFPAKNPHTRSAWQLLETVSEEWRKRVIFVLQQADLTTAEELAVNTAKVAEYARQRRIADPSIFATSAARELAGASESGFEAVRRHIRKTVTGGRHLFLKLRATLDTSESIFEKIAVSLAEARAQLAADRALSDGLGARAEDSRRRSAEQTALMVHQVLDRYDDCAAKLVADFAAGLAVPTFFRRSLGAAVGRAKGLRDWMAGLQQDFSRALDQQISTVIREEGRRILADIETFLGELRAVLDGMSRPQCRPEAPPIDFWQRREEIVSALQRNLEALSPAALFDERLAATPERAGSTLVGGSAMTLVGALLLATTHITLLDVTGGILTGTGLILTGGVLAARRGRMRRELEQGLKNQRRRLGEELQARLEAEVERLHSQIRRQLDPLEAYVAERQAALAAVDQQGQALGRDFERLTAAVSQAGLSWP